MENEVQLKKYVLADAIKSSAQIFQKVSLADKDGLRLDTPRKVGLFLQHVFTDKNGIQKKTRYKQGANSIFMDVQMKPEGGNIPANDKYTDEERNEMFFINGVKVTSDAFVQSFLDKDNNPQREDFTGRSRGQLSGIFRELDEVAIADDENKFIRETAQALTKIFAMELTEVQSLVALLFGASFPTPPRLQDCQNLCAKALEGNEERINLVLHGDWGKDGEVTVLLNRALTKGIISLTNKPDFVQMKKGGAWVDVKMVVADSPEQKEILFKQHLASEAGELLKTDIESMLGGDVKATEEKDKANKINRPPKK